MTRIAKPYAEHKRQEVQAFGYDEGIHRLEPFARAEAFIEFLAIADEPLPVTKKATKKAAKKATKQTFTFDNFVQKANTLAESMKDECECLLSLFLAFLADI